MVLISPVIKIWVLLIRSMCCLLSGKLKESHSYSLINLDALYSDMEWCFHYRGSRSDTTKCFCFIKVIHSRITESLNDKGTCEVIARGKANQVTLKRNCF